jgi:hypothetical protein
MFGGANRKPGRSRKGAKCPQKSFLWQLKAAHIQMDERQRRRETVAAFFIRYAEAVGDPVIARGAETIRRSYPGRPAYDDADALAEIADLRRQRPSLSLTKASLYVAGRRFSAEGKTRVESIARRLRRKARQ